MDWLSFFIGVLVGWIVEWLIDLFYWRRRYQSCCKERDALQARLAEAEKRITTFQVKGYDPEAEARRIPAADVATEVVIERPAADLDVELETTEVEVRAADLEVSLEAPEVEVPDTGIDAFFDELRARFPDADLDGSIDRLRARFPDLDLKTALHGLKVDFPDLDIDGAFDSLKARFAHLAAGAAIGGAAAELGDRHAELPTIAPQQPDDLKRIEGIGPKIARLLNDNGILTFAQLANTSSEYLQVILQAGGPNFQLADPTTWPQQARLAADEAWDELQAIQDQLTGGRTSRHRRQ